MLQLGTVTVSKSTEPSIRSLGLEAWGWLSFCSLPAQNFSSGCSNHACVRAVPAVALVDMAAKNIVLSHPLFARSYYVVFYVQSCVNTQFTSSFIIWHGSHDTSSIHPESIPVPFENGVREC